MRACRVDGVGERRVTPRRHRCEVDGRRTPRRTSNSAARRSSRTGPSAARTGRRRSCTLGAWAPSAPSIPSAPLARRRAQARRQPARARRLARLPSRRALPVPPPRRTRCPKCPSFFAWALAQVLALEPAPSSASPRHRCPLSDRCSQPSFHSAAQRLSQPRLDLYASQGCQERSDVASRPPQPSARRATTDSCPYSSVNAR